MGIIRKELYTTEQNAVAYMFNLLSHPGRLKIIFLLLSNERLNLGEIREQLGLSQSAVSDQVKILKDAEFIIGREVGTSVFYYINMEVWNCVKQLNYIFWNTVDDRFSD